MTIIELPRRRQAPRLFFEAAPGLLRRVDRALVALGNLPPELDDLPGLGAVAHALVELLDFLEGDTDLEPDCDDEVVSVDDLPLFAAAATRRPP